MFSVVCLCLLISAARGAPGYDLNDLDFYSPPLIKAAPFIPAPAPVLKSFVSAPIVAPAPVIPAAPVFKTVASLAPVVKTVAPATSYASVTQYHVTHPVVKTIIPAAPIIKSYVSAPLDYEHSYH